MLPFPLTADQERAIEAIDRRPGAAAADAAAADGGGGSGKTVVALYALLRAVEQGYQGALMAPTETLAEQHFATIQALMPGEAVPVGLLTGSTPARRRADLLGKLASGELSLVVGTHALIEDPVRFARLGRGGGRRAAPLRRAPAGRAGCQGRLTGCAPHVLHMTATPIPRTLALAGYGDLDFTVAARAAPRAPADPDVRVLDRAASGRGRTSGCARSCGPGARRSSSARWWRSPRLLPARAATAEFERLRDGRAARLPRRAAARADAPGGQAGGDGGVRLAARPTCSWPPR